MDRSATPAGPIGLILPTFAQDPASLSAAPTELADVCRAAEQRGVGALWACDHLFWHGPTLECLTALTIAAQATERPSIGSCILQLPLRQPGSVAKQVASIQSIAGGRIVLGVGVGSHPGEYEQAGVAYEDRGRLLDAGIVELRRCWATARQPSEQESEADRTRAPSRPAYRQLPEPPPVPVWVGGSSPAARRRAARLGDGWIPLFVDVERYARDVVDLADEVAAEGRDVDAVTPAMVLFVSVDDDPARALRRGTGWMSSMYALPPKAFERHIVSGTARTVADVIGAYRDAGARHVAVYVTDDHPLEQFDQLVAALSIPAQPAVR
jgi:alkanesulfonate monooxygenase SsuD/methylene tetrahydromethanopterin reductase-like flavin-dependent oxidoreductase (luciferase family)